MIAGLGLDMIEVEQGQSQISLLGQTAETIEAIDNFKILVSLSHLKAMASAL